MTKRVTKLIALFFAMALALSGCSMVKIDKAMDDAEVVAEFAGGTVQKGEAMKTYNEIADMYKNYYGLTDASMLESLKGDVLLYMAEDRIKELKAQELGFALTEEEQEAKKAEAKTQYDELVALFKDQYVEEGKPDEEATAEAQTHLEEMGYTLSAIEEQIVNEAWNDRLFEHVTKDVTVDEAALQAAYDAKVNEDQSAYEADLISFEYAMMNGETSAWNPDGYRTVKHILVKMPDEQSAEIGELQSKLSDVEYDLDVLAQPELFEEMEETENTDDDDAFDTGIDPDVMEDAISTDEPPASVEDLQAQKAQLEKQIAELKAKYAEELQPRVDEIMARIEAGEDFLALVEEVGEDPGMLSEPAKTKGYYVHKDSELWDKVFTEAAMSIDKVGGIAVSQIGNNGIHIIRYETDVPAGPVPLDELRTQLEETALSDLKNEKFTEQVDAWVMDAKVKVYPERMK